MTTYTVYRTSYNDQHVETDYRALMSTPDSRIAVGTAECLRINAQTDGLQRKYDVVETQDEVVGWVK